MGYILIAIGLMLTIAGVRDKQSDLYTLIQGDFTGDHSFIYWLGAIAIVGGAGYIPAFKGLSTAFLTLILIVLVLKQGTGFFDQFTAALQQSTAPAAPTAKAG